MGVFKICNIKYFNYLKIKIMRKIFVTIALMGAMGYIFAQETPKTTTKSKSKQDTIVNHTKTRVEKKSTYKADTTKSTVPKKRKSVSKTPKTGKDSIPN